MLYYLIVLQFLMVNKGLNTRPTPRDHVCAGRVHVCMDPYTLSLIRLTKHTFLPYILLAITLQESPMLIGSELCNKLIILKQPAIADYSLTAYM